MTETPTELRTGQLAKRAGVNIQTLRYYERRRLLAVPARRASGQRAYPESAVSVVRAIKAAQRLGFTLNEIHELLSLSRRGRANTDDLHLRAHAKMMEVERRIADLEQVRHSLRAALTANCTSLIDCSCGWTSVT
jgi:DNA-binding transcriptional MerR regulator